MPDRNRIAGADFAFAGGAIADDASAKQTVPITDVIAPASINDFVVASYLQSSGRVRGSENLPIHRGLSDVSVN
jgi:hypothetical protein